MSLVKICDYCGEEIADDDSVTIAAKGREEDPDHALGWRAVTGYLGHYHATAERPCYSRLFDAIDLVHDAGPTLETIETRSNQWVGQQRRRHRRADPDE